MILLLFLSNFDEELMILGIVGVVEDGGWMEECVEIPLWRVAAESSLFRYRS